MNSAVTANSDINGSVSSSFTHIVIVAVFMLVWFVQLGYRDLTDPDEGRYAEIPREMVASGDWLTPRLNDFKYFEKPPLQYWASAVLFKLFGQSNTTARLWPALCGLLGAVWIAYVSSRIYGQSSGHYAFLFCLSSALYFVCGHVLTLDMALTVMLSFALGALLLAQQQRSNDRLCRNWMLASWTAVAAAVLTKGLVALVLPAAVVLVYSIVHGDWAIWRKLYLGRGLLILALIDAPWFIAMSIRHQEFAQFFFIHEHFARYLTTAHDRNGPLLYFLPVLFIGSLPWAILTLKSLRYPPHEHDKPERRGDWNAQRFLWLFVIVILVFFSLSKSKLPAYILPVFPALAILNARSLMQSRSLLPDALLTTLIGVALFMLALNVDYFISDTEPLSALLKLRPWLIASGGLLLAAALAMYGYRRIGGAAIVLAAGLASLAFNSLLLGSQAVTASRSAYGAAAFIEHQSLPADTPVYLIGKHAPSLAFYLQQPVALVAKRGELTMGIDAEPQKWLPDASAFVKQWHSQPRAIAVIDNENIPNYSALGLTTKPQYQDLRTSVIIKNNSDRYVVSSQEQEP